jgi:hypothetical protein
VPSIRLETCPRRQAGKRARTPYAHLPSVDPVGADGGFGAETGWAGMTNPAGTRLILVAQQIGSAARMRRSYALQRIRPYRTDRPSNTAYAEMNEAVGGVQNGHGDDQSFEDGNECCHGACTAKLETPPNPPGNPFGSTTPLLGRASRCLAVEVVILPEW